MKPSIRLSQCMIVKDEEKNIRQALSWGKGIVHEQIVVDTGSTDRTVEIAEEMGAKVFHFPWNDDFSAAKNFAIEQAKGNWIAFLDADEYFSDDDARKILPLLKQMEKDFYPATRPHVIRTLLVNLNDSHENMATGVQERIFRNIPTLRYHNRIHEYLNLTDGSQLFSYDAKEMLAIFHTGYAPEVFKEKNKEERNILMVKKELEDNPENYLMWSYLGDAFLIAERLEEAEDAYLHVIEHLDTDMKIDRKDLTFSYLMKVKVGINSDSDEEILTIYQKAKDYGCTSPDIDYWVGEWFYRRGDEERARRYFEQSLHLLEQYKGTDPLNVSARLSSVYQRIFFSYAKLNLFPEMVRYGVVLLRFEPYHADVLKEVLNIFKRENGEEKTANATFGFLSKLYDLSLFKNKLFLMKVAERVPFPALEKQIDHLLSEKERKFVAEAGDIF